MTQPLDKEGTSYSILRAIGYGLLLLVLLDIIHLLIPPGFLNPAWEFQTIGQLIERVAVPLLGLGLVFYGEDDYRSKWEGLFLKFLSWASLVTGVLFLLLAPLLLMDSFRLGDQIDYQVNTQSSQQLEQLEQIEQQLGQATTDKDINIALTRLKIQGLPPTIKNPQEAKSKVLSEVTKAKKTLKSQTDAVGGDKRLNLLKSSIKWFSGALVSGVLFIYIWNLTRWARRGRKYNH
jgi:hypothetical protein